MSAVSDAVIVLALLAITVGAMMSPGFVDEEARWVGGSGRGGGAVGAVGFPGTARVIGLPGEWPEKVGGGCPGADTTPREKLEIFSDKFLDNSHRHLSNFSRKFLHNLRTRFRTTPLTTSHPARSPNPPALPDRGPSPSPFPEDQ